MAGRNPKKANYEKIQHFCGYHCGFSTQSVTELFDHVQRGVCRVPSVNLPPSTTPLSSNNTEAIAVDITEQEEVIVVGDSENEDSRIGMDIGENHSKSESNHAISDKEEEKKEQTV